MGHPLLSSLTEHFKLLSLFFTLQTHSASLNLEELYSNWADERTEFNFLVFFCAASISTSSSRCVCHINTTHVDSRIEDDFVFNEHKV